MTNKLLILALALPLLGSAATIFSDGFEAGPAGLNVIPVGWSVTSGTVDIIGFGCHAGSLCVDLDGSSNQAGILSRTFSATGGVTYSLSFWLNNSNRGSNETVDVMLGTSTLQIAVPSSMPLTQFGLTWTAASTGTASVSFHNLGGDNVGAILDDVNLSSAAAIWSSTGAIHLGVAWIGRSRNCGFQEILETP